MRYTDIELLAPARNADIAIEAIRHGADAVYIGAPKFGARAEAGNSVDDIKVLCRYAHIFRAKVYAALNTILKDEELQEAQEIAWSLYVAGVDALIVQDMALLEMNMPPLPLHASTQMNNSSAEQVRWLQDLGFSRAVLARELSLDEISSIHSAVPDMPLEVFVHGSICVSLNGQCYASQHCFSRSANRGECAQFCRLPFDLVDAEGRTLERQRHLLSLRDMNRSAHLEALLDAGVTSLKIEGRLKDVAYVKNVVAYYRQRLDEIMARRPSDYRRSSLGRHTYTFTPRLEAVFNRGFTDYFLRGRTEGICNRLSPKSVGEPVGEVVSIGAKHIEVAGDAIFSNGDGLCFFDQEGQLCGFRLNRVEAGKLFPLEMPAGLMVGTMLYRNHNHALEKLLNRPSATRKIPVDLLFCDENDSFTLRATAAGGIEAETHLAFPHERARIVQDGRIERQLKRLGGTCFECNRIRVRMERNWFVPVSLLNSLRNSLVQILESEHRQSAPPNGSCKEKHGRCVVTAPFKGQPITYSGNVANHLAEAFYLKHGATSVEKAMEVEPKSAADHPLLMTCRHCILFDIGACLKEGKPAPTLPLHLRLADGRCFTLVFNCDKCNMQVYAQ